MKKEKKKGKAKNIIRNIFGVLFIFSGLSGMNSGKTLAGLLMVLFGISLIPIFYEKTKLNIKHIQVILPIILMIATGMAMPQTTTKNNVNINQTNTNIQENKNIEITNLRFNETEIELDVKETKNIVLEINSPNANTENLKFCTTDNKIATLEKTNVENTEGKMTLKIKPIAEGTCEIFVKSTNGIESNKIIVRVIDKEKIEQEKKEKEEQAKREAEEQVRKEAEEQKKREAEEQARKEAEEQEKKRIEEQRKKQETTQSNKPTTQNNNSNSKNTSTNKGTSSSSNSNNTHGKTVYRTPSGKRYHFDPDCGGKNSYQTTLDAAKSSGLTPCQKCAK